MSFPFRTKNQVPELDVNLADQMLQNVFEISQVAPSSIPLDVLISYSNYRKERFAFQKFVLIAIIILFSLIPFLFVYPEFEIVPSEDTTHYPPVYEFSLDTNFPIKSVSATLNKKPISVSQTGKKSFSLEPTENGVLSVSVTLMNNQVHTAIASIDTMDTKSPVYHSNSIQSGIIYLYVSDDLSGVDYENVTAKDSEGNTILPIGYSEANESVIFDYPNSTLDVYVPDLAGNTLHLVLNVH